MQLAEYTERWSRNILQLKKPATIASFSSHIRKMNEYFGPLELADLTEARVQEHVTALSKVLSPKGLNNYWSTFRIILQRAKREGIIGEVPSPELPKITKNPQPWLTANQMKQIVDASEGQYKVLFYLLAETGMRIGEALALQWKDIDFKNSSLSIERSIFNGKVQTPKTGNAVRNLSISEKFCEQIRSLKSRTQSDFLFTTSKNSPLAANAVGRKLHSTLRLADYPKTGFHAFRRGNCTIMANLGIPEKIAATRIGHGLGLTFGLYAQFVHLADKPYVELIAKELGGSSNG